MDLSAAWTGSLADRPNIPMRIEAAAYRGKPVYFELIGPWTHAELMQPYEPTTGERASYVIGVAPCSHDGTCALAGGIAMGPLVQPLLFLRLWR
jgi:hypothetical protein